VGIYKKPVLPDVIARELAGTPAGQITVIDFADFECPWCRMTHAELAPVLAAHAGKVHLVRKHVPLERMHPHALDAARAACCGERMGQGPAMAEALFSAPVDDLTADGCAKLALSLGLDGDAFRKCMQDPAIDARIRADQATFKASGARGLPTLWIGDEKIEGASPRDVLESAVSRAIDQRS
jgi:predicted DsbA family dithiol-disulfide isomerase